MPSRHLARLALGLATICSVAVLGAPAAHATSQAAPVNLTFQAWDDTTVTNQFIVPCEKKYPNIHVKTEPVAGDYSTKLQTEFASGTAPDFFYAEGADALKWAAAGEILNQLPYLKAMGVNPTKDFLPQSQYWAPGKKGSYFLGRA